MKATKKLLRTAYHEAGHAYADYSYGIAIKLVTITPDGDSLGHIKRKNKLSGLIEQAGLSKRQVQEFYEYCVTLFAGQASEKFFRGHSSTYGASGDRRKAVDIVMHLFGTKEAMNAALRLFYIQAKYLVITPRSKLLIPRLAKTLVKKKTLTGDEVKALFREVMKAKFSKRDSMPAV